jgi:hypothetical protein
MQYEGNDGSLRSHYCRNYVKRQEVISSLRQVNDGSLLHKRLCPLFVGVLSLFRQEDSPIALLVSHHFNKGKNKHGSRFFNQRAKLAYKTRG